MGGTVVAGTIQTSAGGPVALTGQSAAKAWTNLNGTGTIAERDSFNISSYVDNGAGDYSMNMSTSMANIVYQIGGAVQFALANSGRHLSAPLTDAPTVSALRFGTAYDANFIQDCEYAFPCLHGDLA